MRLHVVSLPWTATTSEYLTCAYTQKLVKFCRMMEPRGHEVVLYASEENEAPVSEHVAILSEEERFGYFGKWGSEALLQRVTWDNRTEPWLLFNSRAIEAIRERAEERELVLLVGGNCQRPIYDALPNLVVEPFVGYEGVFTHAAFESHTWRSHVYGLEGTRNGRWFDATIPNYFDPDEFPDPAKLDPPGAGEYLLFVGRLVERKGPHVAAELADAFGMPLVVAGPGGNDHGLDLSRREHFIQADEVRIANRIGCDYVGEIDAERRALLMAGAYAFVCPTFYIEPFCGVAVESMMMGTPVLATDWGAFTETVQHGETGFRFRTLREGVEFLERMGDLDRAAIRDYAFDRYSLKAVAPQFERWFEQLDSLWRDGWNELARPLTAAA